MAGNREGGLRAAATNKAKHGDDFYKRIGTMGGATTPTKPRGFATMPKEKIAEAGAKGGRISRREALTPEERERKSKRMKQAWELLKENERSTT